MNFKNFFFVITGPGAIDVPVMRPGYFAGDIGKFYLTNARRAGRDDVPEVINFTELANRADPYDVSPCILLHFIEFILVISSSFYCLLCTIMMSYCPQ